MSMPSSNEERPLGLDIVIDCPACGRPDVSARAYEQHDRVLLEGLIPITALINTWVICGSCGKKLHARVRLSRLVGMTHAERGNVIRVLASPVERFLAVVALLTPVVPLLLILALSRVGRDADVQDSVRVVLSFFPFIALLAGIAGVIVNRRTPGWPKIASLIGMSLAVVLCLLTGASLLLGPQGGRP